jgi:hypothetical protein
VRTVTDPAKNTAQGRFCRASHPHNRDNPLILRKEHFGPPLAKTIATDPSDNRGAPTMTQSAASDLPHHQGLFNLSKNAAPFAVVGSKAAAPAAMPAPKPSAPTTNLVAKPTLTTVGGSTQVQPKPVAAMRRAPEAAAPISRGRYLKTLEHLAKTEESRSIGQIVSQVRAREVEQAVQLAARARARYLACVVDLGANRAPISRNNIEELAALRKAHEELTEGIDALTNAIREGLIDIVGVGE